MRELVQNEITKNSIAIAFVVFFIKNKKNVVICISRVKICCCQQQERAAYSNNEDGNSRLSSAAATRPILINTTATLSALAYGTQNHQELSHFKSDFGPIFT